VLFILGALLAFGFNGLAVMADLNGGGFWGEFGDAASFDRAQPISVDLTRIQCPILLAPGEVGTIHATIWNPNQYQAEALVKVVVSEGDLNHYRALSDSLTIAARSRQDFRWQITRQDIVEENFIFTRIFLIYLDMPARTESCGVLVLDLFGLPGAALVVLALVTSFVFLLVGNVLLYRRNLPYLESSPSIENGRIGLSAILLAGMIANLLGWWVFAGLLLVLALLLIISIIPGTIN